MRALWVLYGEGSSELAEQTAGNEWDTYRWTEFIALGEHEWKCSENKEVRKTTPLLRPNSFEFRGRQRFAVWRIDHEVSGLLGGETTLGQ